MALMQAFPRFSVGDGAFSSSRPVPMVRAGARVEFRSGAELSGVVEVITENLRVEVEAAPGAGKSSRLPLALAQATGALVLHVVPHLPMAVSVYRYMVRIAGGIEVTLLTDISQQWPSSGVAVVSAGMVVAGWLSQASVVLPECYVLQDESHESGAASAVMRYLTPVCSGVLSHVVMSATFGPTGARRMETGGAVEERTYEPEAFADPWSVEDDDAPWAASTMDDHALIFEDDKRRASALIEAYNMNGARAYLVHSRTTAPEFAGVLDALEDGRNAVPCVVVADSSYRSGHTFKVSLIVDSGLVKRVAVDERGRPVEVVRAIYEAEAVQTRSRAGRIPGQRSVYYRPRAQLEKKTCDLEQTDVEAAALIFRALGFSVPKWARAAKMADGPVPRDLWRALSSQTPLALLTVDQLDMPKRGSDTPAVPQPAQSAVSGFPVSDSKPVEHASVLERGLPSAVVSAPPVPAPEPPERGSALGRSILHDLEQAADVVKMVQSGGGGQAEYGSFYAAHGVVTTDVSCFAFPQGVESVKRMLAQDVSGTLQNAWSATVRSVAVNLLVNSYNMDMLGLHAYTEVLRAVRTAHGVVTPEVGRWISTVTEHMVMVGVRSEYVLELAQRVAEGFCTFIECNDLFEDEKKAYVTALAGQYDVASTSTAVDARSEELARVRAWRIDASSSNSSGSDVGARAGIGAAVQGGGFNYTGHRPPTFIGRTAGGRLAFMSRKPARIGNG